MAEKRMIHAKIQKSKDFGRLTFRQKAGFLLLIVLADDQGRFLADPIMLRSLLFPFDAVTPDEMEEDLLAWSERGMVLLYTKNGERYGQVANWWRHQQPRLAKPSDLPAPEGWVDRSKIRVPGKDKFEAHNWEHPGGFDVPAPAKEDSPKPEPSAPKDDDSDLELSDEEGETAEIVLSDANEDSTMPLSAPIETDIETETVTGTVEQQQTRARASPPAAAAANPLGAITTLYENNIGPLTGMLRDELGALCDEGVTVEMFQYAVQQACEHNARNLAYVRAITDRILRQGWESVRASPNGRRTSRAADMMRRTDEAAERFLAEAADG